MPAIEINLNIDAKKRASINRESLAKKAADRKAGTYKEKPSQNIAWKDVVKNAEFRANQTSTVLDYNKANPDPSLEAKMSGPIKTPSGGRAAGALTKMPTKQNDSLDLGEKVPGDSKAQSLRGRAIAKSLMERRSSTQTTPKTEIPNAPKAKPTKAPSITTDTGEQAGAIKSLGRAPKDLGRVTTKVLKGNYGDISPKTASQVKGSFLGRAAESVVSKLGSTLGSYGTISLGAKAASAFRGMKKGMAVDPLTFDTIKPKEGDEIITPTGKRKVKKGEIPVES